MIASAARRLGLSTFVRCLDIDLEASLDLGEDCCCKIWQTLLNLAWSPSDHIRDNWWGGRLQDGASIRRWGEK
jgi:hypothetical protein